MSSVTLPAPLLEELRRRAGEYKAKAESEFQFKSLESLLTSPGSIR